MREEGFESPEEMSEVSLAKARPLPPPFLRQRDPGIRHPQSQDRVAARPYFIRDPLPVRDPQDLLPALGDLPRMEGKRSSALFLQPQGAFAHSEER